MSVKVIAMTPRAEAAPVKPAAGPIARAALAGLLLGALLPGAAQSHAALVAAEAAQAIAINARYDTGEPMAGAQVVIYAPDDPASVWGRGTTDAEGQHVFLPDPALTGRWTIQVRQAGHGAITHVEITANGTGAALAITPATPVGQSPLQRLLMVALVAWGALGTALFFRRSKGAGRDASS